MNNVVTQEDWLAARLKLLAREKEHTKVRDELAEARLHLPWTKVEKEYVFEGPNGQVEFGDLFGGKHQLIVYHLMYAPEWETPCKSCSFWADHFDGMIPHLAARDVQLIAVSRAPQTKLKAIAQRMGWEFPWFSSGEGPFNYDLGVSFRPEQYENGTAIYNYEPMPFESSDMPGVSTFFREGGAIYHAYSAYARGIDALNTTYQYLDIAPLGRNEDGLEQTMDWVKLHDEYAVPA